MLPALMGVISAQTAVVTPTTVFPHYSSLSGYWKSDTNGSYPDATINAHNGTITNATYTASGILNEGYDFNGTSAEININDDSDFDFGTGAFSISAWFKPDVVSRYNFVISKATNSGTWTGWIILQRSDNNFELYTGDTAALRLVNTNVTASPGTWYHLVATRSAAGVISLYVNNDKVSKSTTASNLDNSYKVVIGNADLESYWCDGTLDELGIWKGITLSDSQVSDLYNSGSALACPDLKVWTTGGNLGTARRGHGGCGTIDAGLCIAGYVSSGVTSCEEYDGSSWSAGGNVSVAIRNNVGAGTQTAALSIGGYTTGMSSITSEYDGSSWSGGGNLLATRRAASGGGTQTASFIACGESPGVDQANSTTEEYDGSSWSVGGNTSTSRRGNGGCGTLTAGLVIAGVGITSCEEYDGSSWSSGGSISAQNYSFGASGLQNTALMAGGNTEPWRTTGTTAEYDGTAWANTGTLNTPRYSGPAGAGSSSAGLSFAGYTGSNSAVTEEFN